MKKLLIATSTFPQSSEDTVTARFVFDLAVALMDHYKVYVVAPHFNNSKIKEVIKGVIVYRFKYFFPATLQLLTSGNGMLNDIKRNPLALLQLPAFFISSFFSTLSIVRKENIDIINSHWVVPQGFICALVKKITGVKHVVTAHAADIFMLKRFGIIGKAVTNFIIKNSDIILPVSNYIKEKIMSLSSLPKTHAIVSMGANINKFIVTADKKVLRERLCLDNKFTFLFVGKLIEKKGLDSLIHASKILKDKNLDFNLVIVGGGPLEQSLRYLSGSLGLMQYIKFMGWVKNDSLPDIYSASDVLVVPSIFDKKGETEGLPVVIVEAMACGIPVIGSRISGIPEIVSDNENGMLFSPGEANELAQKMYEMMSRNDIGRFREEALKTSKSYSWHSISEKYRVAIEHV